MLTAVRRVMLALVFIAWVGSLIGYLATKPNMAQDKQETYVLLISSKTPADIETAQKTLQEKGLEGTRGTVEKYDKVLNGFEVSQDFDKGLIDSQLAILKTKNIPAEIIQDEDTGKYFIRIKKVYKTEKEAQNAVEFVAKKTQKTVNLHVRSNYDKIPYQANQLVIKDIPDQTQAEELKETLSQISKEIEVEILPQSEYNSQENIEEPQVQDTQNPKDKKKHSYKTPNPPAKTPDNTKVNPKDNPGKSDK